ncbi:MAG: hypothetical protein A4E73_00433 [Syntrophaceae bacterium PtaU1.Bin231]|nr:MAG: hypothetical protein A4E73_00433 [Syntrophaceae bacterium PtaU1.Bin231]
MLKRVHYLYALSFLAAFLLFQIELVIAKIFLPRFGGSYLVWGSCIVFFQFALLLGYLYTHVAVRKFGMYRYRYLHLIFILLPLLFFPGRALPEIAAHPGLPLVVDIFMQLAFTIGTAFFVLSTISIVTQTWLAHSDLPESRNPFTLYAVSNAGSFLGLLSYPFFFETYFDLDVQVAIWRILYALFILTYIVSLRAVSYSDRTIPAGAAFGKSFFGGVFRLSGEGAGRKLSWFLLSAAGCILFLAVTNVMTYEIAPCPLLWVVPLCIYLVSFTLTFRDRPLYPQWITDKFHLVMGFSVLIYFFTQGRILPVTVELIAFSVALFALCMFCQHEIYESRPLEKGDLTGFYLIVATGGFAGSMLVTWIVPRLFTSTVEFLLGLFLVALALGLKQGRERIGFYNWRLIAYCAVLIVAWPFRFKVYNVVGVAVALLAFAFIFRDLFKNRTALGVCLLVVFAMAPFVDDMWRTDGHTVRSYRNYYGIYNVSISGNRLQLTNGNTLHGLQYITDDPVKRAEPLAYYHRGTPVGRVLESGFFKTGRIGVVGLGVGTLSAYGRKGEAIDFFELDPDVPVFVSAFDYLKRSDAKLTFYFDDARLALKKTPPAYYDILVIDAFSGDSVPVHLLTTEAIREYKVHVKDGGLILFHISNRYIDLAPVLFSNARAVKALAVSASNTVQGSALLASDWMALTWDRGSRDTLVSRLQWKDKGADPDMKLPRPWTDKYSNIPSVAKPRVLVNSIRDFQPFSW